MVKPRPPLLPANALPLPPTPGPPTASPCNAPCPGGTKSAPAELSPGAPTTGARGGTTQETEGGARTT
eukprot:10809542-Lingulodinium_polyedra.AAC.1